MKLYLSSYRIPRPDVLTDLVGKPAAKIRVAVIFNAHDGYPEDQRAEKAADLAGYFTDHNFNWDRLDLREYFGRSADLMAYLQQMDAVWAAGGNTYALRSAMRRSGFDQVSSRLVEEGLIYGGDSAGAIVAGPDLHFFETADDPALAEELVYEGLNLTEQVVIPHWGSEKYASVLEDTLNNHRAAGHQTTVLTDEQVLVINGHKKTVY